MDMPTQQLQARGVPARASVSGGFFKAAEIGVMVSLLRVIDNPNQDIPLLAVLMSPLYGFFRGRHGPVAPGEPGGECVPLAAAGSGGGTSAAAKFCGSWESTGRWRPPCPPMGS